MFNVIVVGVDAIGGVELSVAVKAGVAEPATVGVPLIAPAALRARPVGRPVAVQV
jgi:hypothetical protein